VCDFLFGDLVRDKYQSDFQKYCVRTQRRRNPSLFLSQVRQLPLPDDEGNATSMIIGFYPQCHNGAKIFQTSSVVGSGSRKLLCDILLDGLEVTARYVQYLIALCSVPCLPDVRVVAPDVIF
jgi:hypothetical protein